MTRASTQISGNLVTQEFAAGETVAWLKKEIEKRTRRIDDCRLSSRRESTGFVVVAQRLQAIQIVRARVEEPLPFRDSLFCVSICLCRCDANGVCRQFI